MVTVIKSNAAADEELYKDFFSSIKEAFREQTKASQEDTGITFVTLLKAFSAL